MERIPHWSLLKTKARTFCTKRVKMEKSSSLFNEYALQWTACNGLQWGKLQSRFDDMMGLPKTIEYKKRYIQNSHQKPQDKSPLCTGG